METMEDVLKELADANRRANEATARKKTHNENGDAIHREWVAAQEHKYKIEAKLLRVANGDDPSVIVHAAEDDR